MKQVPEICFSPSMLRGHTGNKLFRRHRQSQGSISEAPIHAPFGSSVSGTMGHVAVMSDRRNEQRKGTSSHLRQVQVTSDLPFLHYPHLLKEPHFPIVPQDSTTGCEPASHCKALRGCQCLKLPSVWHLVKKA